MKKIFLQLGLISSLAFLACNETETASAETVSSEQQETEALLLNTQPAMPGGASAATPASVITQPAGTGQASKGSAQAAKTTASLNPPHGEPGHRCDIEVGAPLDGSPKTISVTPSSPSATEPLSITPSGGTGKTNPPHGEPGHDCTKPVGAPL